MKQSMVIAAAVAASLALVQAASAEKAVHKRAHAKMAPAPSAGFVQAPPRMVEIRPGYWISSWGCVTDEGQGRLRDCSVGESRL